MMEKREKKPGFTIVEMLAVASLLTILSTFALSTVSGTINFKKNIDTEARADELKGALVRYFEDVGVFPAGSHFTGLSKLSQNSDNKAGWKGSYVDPKASTQIYSDGWKQDFRYLSGVSPTSGMGVALVLSPGRNGRVDSNLTNWTSDGWVPAGDDIARKASIEEIVKRQEAIVRRQLLIQKGRLIARNPNYAPMNFALPNDIWGHSLLYARCSPYSVILYSAGYNGLDNSGGVSGICSRGYPLGDDIMETTYWERTGRLAGLLNDGWTGGLHANQAICSSYTYVAMNQLNDPLIIHYYNTQLQYSTLTVPANSTRYISSVYPWMMTGNRVPLVVYRNGIEYDDFLGANADLDQDCYYQKIFYNTGG